MGNASGRADEMDEGVHCGAYDSSARSSERGLAPYGGGNHVRGASSAGYVGGSEPPGSPPRPHSPRMFVPQAPDEKEFTKEPPALPAQLYLGVLNSRSSEGECTMPKHVVLNHLYIEKGWGAQPLVALGHTQRFRSKYVTTVLYKAIER